MHEKMNLLRELQEVDQELAEIAEVRAKHESELKVLDADRERVEQMVAELTAQLDELQHEEAQLQQEQLAEKDQISKVEARLPEIQTQKEYVAVLKEIDMAKKASLETQGKISEKEKEISELQSDLEEKQTELNALSEKSEARQAEVVEVLSGNDAKAAARQSTRDSLAKDLPKQLLRKYQQIFLRRNGLAVARVEDGACLGCNMQLPPQQYNQLHRGTELQSCPHCNRLLFLEKS